MKLTRKLIFTGIGVILLIAGGVWFLQGINILPGSYMTGDPQWAINGAIAMGVGMLLVWFGIRK